MEYKPDTCAYCGAETWCERRSNGKPQCRACKVVRFFRNVLYAPLGYTLLAWQEKVLRDVYGGVGGDGRRMFRQAYVSVAKKNGKSFLVGGLPTYHLLCEDEPRPEAFGAAAAKEQASIVFKAAAHLVKANPLLRDKLRIVESTKRILRRDGNGSYVVLSADGDVADGIEPSLGILDEIHRWKTAKARTLYNVIIKGMISRAEPLAWEITTAGAQYESELWFEEHDYARKILDGSLKSDRFYAAIWAADEKRIAEDAEYWKSRESRIAANPSHEDLGGFLRDEAIVGELQKAIDNPAKKPDYLRYHLNVPLTTDEEPAIDMHQWRACGGGVDLREWPEYDVDLLIRKWGLMDKPCYAGVDVSSTTDLTALALVFPSINREPWSVLLFFWMAKATVQKLKARDHVPYDEWARRGFIETTDLPIVDTRKIRDRIHWAQELFDLRDIGFDPWNSREVAGNLIDEGFHCFAVQQGFGSLNEPTKKLLELYISATIQHGNNPVLDFNASCLSVKSDGNDNIKPAKPIRGKSSKRIDGIAAIADAISRWTVAEVQPEPGFLIHG